MRPAFAAMFAALGIALTAQTPSPSPLPTASVSPSPVPSATPAILMLAPDAPPQIEWTSISTTTPAVGENISGTVLCSSNVASVELRVAGFSMTADKTDVGHFEWHFIVPKLPPFMSHTFALAIIARNTAGTPAQTSITIHVR